MKLSKLGVAVPIIVAFLNTNVAFADGVKETGLLETVIAECENLGGEALAIQAIRFELNDITIDELIEGLDKIIKQENPEGSKNQPLFLHRVRAVAKWVFYHYPPNFDEQLVGSTYEIECKNKTTKQVADKYPHLFGEGTKKEQERRAWEAEHPEAHF